MAEVAVGQRVVAHTANRSAAAFALDGLTGMVVSVVRGGGEPLYMTRFDNGVVHGLYARELVRVLSSAEIERLRVAADRVDEVVAGLLLWYVEAGVEIPEPVWTIVESVE